MEFQRRHSENPFVNDDVCLTPLCQRVQLPSVQKTGQNKTCRFDNEVFVPVSSLCGVLGSLYWFTKCLIFIKVNILSVVYINEKCIYSSETRACTII